MKITDEIAEAAWCAFRDSDKPAPYNQVKDAIAAVAPLIEEAQAKRIVELEAALADLLKHPAFVHPRDGDTKAFDVAFQKARELMDSPS